MKHNQNLPVFSEVPGSPLLTLQLLLPIPWYKPETNKIKM